MNAFHQYKAITQIEPYPYQLATYEALEKGKSIILRAPTGSGKSEAVFVPFLTLKGKSLPNRMIYSLPMRALVNSLHERFYKYANHLDIKAQHGQRPESVLFDADCVVATLDQVITSYACCPLSVGIRHGNIPAGAVTASLLVFDEVHTFEPKLGLQSSIILAERLKDMNIPFVIMSATLPSSLINGLKERLNAQLVDVDEESIPVRKERNVTISAVLNETLSPEQVLECHVKQGGRTIVVCNTVERAIALYSGLLDKMTPPPILIHSRFLDNDRVEKEKAIAEFFSKESKEKFLLISTQVIEVGMDISCDLLLTELATIDALIQRAGRCARWGGNGRLIVFGITSHSPYEKKLVELTQEAIKKYNGHKLSWDLEKFLVDKVLDEYFSELAEPHAGAKAMTFLSRASFEGRPSIAEKAVRDALSVDISIHDDPGALGSKIFLLPRCRLHPGILKRFVKERNPTIWLIEQDRNFKDDYRPQVDITSVTSQNGIYPNKFYIIHSQYAAYFDDKGFVLGEKGRMLEPLEFTPKRSSFEFAQIPLETWNAHAIRTLKVFEEYILPYEEYVYHRLAPFLGTDKDKLLSLFKLCLVLHDLGKLTEDWQAKIGAQDKFLAHSGNIERIVLPPHATVSAYVLQDYFKKSWGNILGDAAHFAIAHHHSVRAAKVPRYRLSDGWYDEVNRVLSETVGVTLEQELMKNFEAQDTPTILSNHFPAFEKQKLYSLYVILSRALRLADRRAMEKFNLEEVNI